MSSAADRRHQRGQALVVILVMLPALMVAGATVLRSTTGAARLVQAQQRSTQAQEMARAALRQCDAVAMASVGATTPDARVTAATAAEAERQWGRLAAWRPGAPGLVKAGGTASTPDAGQGLCLIHRLTDPVAGTRLLITARGLSADAVVVADTGRLAEGAEAWQQSQLWRPDSPCGSPDAASGDPATSPAPPCTPAPWSRRWRTLLQPPEA
ncbi:pilus assembly PilX N-terminal domain-containing protein [Pseudacidovorax intermedius]|uniref:Tfp pilus assembly protein PilX n=1 Tax=Pseudacidovorax intermedius TaxID=433924 RepID=A0A147H9A6_9BURK|nr:pilus assembly PilX N-terminal domain-containing protein [Pseudacidovorax intermedius]KTT26510.1 hypothetical protein NS331_03560 [Pseudacidovorax intermedius]